MSWSFLGGALQVDAVHIGLSNITEPGGTEAVIFTVKGVFVYHYFIILNFGLGLE